MKRYRILRVDFDSSATLVSLVIQEEWDEQVKELHRKNKQKIKENFICEFGEHQVDQKPQNFIDLGSKPFSILAFHNRFADQVRSAFIVGAYYPALTGACALGERILNHLILALRDDYQATPEYKKVYAKQSFDNWSVAVDTLESWGVLLPEVVVTFKQFAGIRNISLHFNPETDKNDRVLTLEAIRYLNDIIAKQFSGFGLQSWFIPGFRGESYIKKEAEIEPFIQKIYLPNCCLVGPEHTLEFEGNEFIVHDDKEYEERKISDEEFRELRRSFTCG